MSEQQTSYLYIECGDGWLPIVKALIAHCEREGIEVHQVKEKFGGLRFYTSPASPEFHGIIHAAEVMSFLICEECGEPGTLRSGSWIRTLCDECDEKRKSK